MPRGLLELLLFIGVDVLPLVFRETVHKYSALTQSEKNDRAVSARFALPQPRDPLLDDSTAKVGVNLPVRDSTPLSLYSTQYYNSGFSNLPSLPVSDPRSQPCKLRK